MKKRFLSLLGILLLWQAVMPLSAAEPESVPFVVQLTRSGENYGHRRALLQVDKTLDELGEDRVRFEIVAYEEGIQALVADNKQTNQLLIKLANRGVTFKACRISMRAWDLTEQDFPLEVEFVPAGAPHVIQRQLEGYKYWRP